VKQLSRQRNPIDFQCVSEGRMSEPCRVRRETDDDDRTAVVSHVANRGEKFRKNLLETFGHGFALWQRQNSMDPMAVTAASGLRARIQSLDMLANNLANSTTAGYKLDREFYTAFGEAEAASGLGARLPAGDQRYTDFSQGTLDPTGSPMDFALQGKGFFSVNGPSGPLYTRNGSFRVSAQGVLTTTDGYAVRATGTQDGKIKLQSNAPIQVGDDGTVSQNGQAIGKMEIADFADPNALSKNGNSYFRPAPDTKTVPATGTTVVQGRLEGSNVVAAESAVRLVGVMRHFEMLQKAINISAQMGKQSIEQVARVTS